MFRKTSVRFDFTKLASPEKVTAHIYCLYATPSEVSRVDAALRRAVHVHPNNVILALKKIMSSLKWKGLVKKKWMHRLQEKKR